MFLTKMFTAGTETSKYFFKVLIYPSLYIFLRILEILVNFAKSNAREIVSQTTLMKINTRHICTKLIFPENINRPKNTHISVVTCMSFH